MPIEYRIIKHRDDFGPILKLEALIWGLSECDSIPTTLLQPMLKNDGAVLIGAYDNQEAIGLCFAFPVRQGNQWALWSHMTGVHPRYQGRDIGFALKQKQREWALEQGFKRICWTFDPLQRRNANFNLNHLSASAGIYHENYYGEMADALNAGMPSDRLEVTWNITKAHKPKSIPLPQGDTHILLSWPHHQPEPITRPIPVVNTQPLYLEIPYDIRQLKAQNKPRAIRWQQALRSILTALFADGHQLTGFVQDQDKEHCWYALQPLRPWFLYVVQCKDGSLYTGITINIDQRLKAHNSGKGAAYTAARRPVTLLAIWQFPNQSTALKAEAAFKKQSREDKMKRIVQRAPFHAGSFITKK